MSIQLNLKISNRMFASAQNYANRHGFDNLQELIRDILREKLFESEPSDGLFTYKASETSLAKNWLLKEEDKAWEHLQKEI